jgi:hypothetical protein
VAVERKPTLARTFFRGLDDVIAAESGGTVAGLENGGQHAQSGGFAGAVGAQQTVDLAWAAGETDVIHGADGAAFFVLEVFAEIAGFDHLRTPSLESGIRVEVREYAKRGIYPAESTRSERHRRSRDLQCTTRTAGELHRSFRTTWPGRARHAVPLRRQRCDSAAIGVLPGGEIEHLTDATGADTPTLIGRLRPVVP